MPGDGPRDFEPPAPPDPNGSKWPKLVFVLVCGLLIGLVVYRLVPREFSSAVPIPHPPPGRPIVRVAYDISVSEPVLTGNMLSGTFRVEFGDFDSNLTGGACMAGDIASILVDTETDGIVTGNCSSDAACNPSLPPGQVGKYYGYCVPEGGQLSGRCWYKPLEAESQVCQKSKFAPSDTAKIWPVREDIGVPAAPPFDVHAFYHNHTRGTPAKWLLVGCLNGKTPACADPTGKNTDKREVYGKAVLIP